MGRFSFSLSHLTKPVCLLRDFLRIIRQTAIKNPGLPRLGSPILFQSRAKIPWGVYHRNSAMRIPLWGEKGHPEGPTRLCGEGRGLLEHIPLQAELGYLTNGQVYLVNFTSSSDSKNNKKA